MQATSQPDDQLSLLQSPPSEAVEKLEQNVIVSELDEQTQLKLDVIQRLLEPCDRPTYGDKLREAAEKLGVSVRSVQQLVKKWEQEGLAGIAQSARADKGQHRISEFWQDFIIKTYATGNKGSKRMSPMTNN